MENKPIFINDNRFYVSESKEGYPFGLGTYSAVSLSLHKDYIHVGSPVYGFPQYNEESLQDEGKGILSNDECPSEDGNHSWFKKTIPSGWNALKKHSIDGEIPFSSIHAIVHEYNEEKEVKRVARKGVSVAGAIIGGIAGPVSAILGSTLGVLLKKEIDEEACEHALLIQFSLPEDDTIYCLNLSYKLDLSEMISLSKLSEYRSIVEFVSKLLHVWDDYSAHNHEHLALESDSSGASE